MKRESLWLSVIYCVAHFPLLLTTGCFYDDWVLYHADPQMNIGLWWNTGRPLTGYFLNMMHALDGTFVPRLVTFVMYLLAALFLLYVLRTMDIVDPAARFLVVVVFAVFPADSTRILAMLACDSLYFCLFFLGWYLVAVYMRKGTLIVRLAALSAFLLSFWLNSLLVFYSLVLLYMIYMFSQTNISFQSVRQFIARYPDFLLIPIVFWLVQRTVFPPQEAEAGYNQFHLVGLYPRHWLSALKSSVADPMIYSAIPFDWFWLAAVLVGAILLFLMLRKAIGEESRNDRRDFVLLICGFYALFAALFPYLAVYKMPGHWDWLSRNARLVPLGTGLVLCFGGRLAFRWVSTNSRAFLCAYCFLVCVMIGGNLRNYADYWLDWYKAVSLVEQFKQSNEIRDNKSFLFQDECRGLNAKRRTYRFYEYGALMNMAFGEDSRFGTENAQWDTRTGLNSVRHFLSLLRSSSRGVDYTKAYFISRWIPEEPTCRVQILCKKPRTSLAALLRLKFLEFFDVSTFRKEVSSLVSLHVAPSCRRQPK